MDWVQINIQVNEDFRYMKIHITNHKSHHKIHKSVSMGLVSLTHATKPYNG